MPADKFQIDGHKMQYHTDRMAQWLKDPTNTFPIYVEISPVGHCNHRCTFCAVDYIGYEVRKLDTQCLKYNLLSMANNGIRSIMYAGEGEPLLHPDISTIINETKRQGIDVSITTNGVALTSKLVDQSIDSITWIKVSLNAGTPATYMSIHKAHPGDWDKVMRNLEYAVSKRKPQTTIGVQCLLLPENQDELANLARIVKNIGVDYLVIKPYSQHLKSITKTYNGIRYEDFKELDWIKDVSDDKFQVICREKSMEQHDAEDRGYHKCYSTPYFWAYIMATGDVYGCSAYLLDERFKYGNINENLFKEIWLGERRKASMEFVENYLDIAECRKNCRMDKVNRYLWDIKNPKGHENFI